MCVFTGALADSETNSTLTAEDLDLTEAQYDALVDESIGLNTTEGHVRAPNGHRVYAVSTWETVRTTHHCPIYTDLAGMPSAGGPHVTRVRITP